MRVNALERRVQLSVRELANFRTIPTVETFGGGLWRAAVGQDWHRTIETQARTQFPEAQFEVPVNLIHRHRDWIFEIQGRLDQLIRKPSKEYLIREIKTIRHPLPEDPEILMDHFPAYFAQAAIYRTMLGASDNYRDSELAAELVFVDIDSGTVQTVPLEPTLNRTLEDQLDLLLPFINDRRDAHQRLSKSEIKPAFSDLRPGQAELFAILDDAVIQSKTVLLEAPTGFGKTGIVLEHALRQMQNGLYDRCIYLTSKSTGQLQTAQQLQAMVGDKLRYLQMRNRAEHRIESAAHTCTGDTQCDAELGHNWLRADIHPPELFRGATVSLKAIQQLGAETGICPYTLSKSCLPFSEIWIGDLNYVFSPGSRNVFEAASGFDPAKTLLIVDEAHNLPDRTADALSVELNAADWLFALEELRLAGASRRLCATGDEITTALEHLEKGRPLLANQVYELLDHFEAFTQELKTARLRYEAVAPFAMDLIWQIPVLAERLAAPSHKCLHWSPRRGTVRATCLDASSWIADCLQPFGSSILMSATLAPYNSFRDSCGLSAENSVLARGQASWREEAYEVAIDCRVDTRFKQRERYYETTARTVAALANSSPGEPIAVFFASYQYAENVNAYLSALAPELRIMVQPRGIELAEQESFLEEALLMADALFLVLGSSYAEGIDLLGGRVTSAMLVGPALPEVNPIQDAKMDAHPSLSREDNFRDVYILPAMRRIHQALGRLVRAPQQRARVLLHCRRFAEPAYHQELAPEYASQCHITSDGELLEWLAKKN